MPDPIDPFLPLTFAQENSDPSVTLFDDELERLATGIAILVIDYNQINHSLQGLDQIARFNDLFVDITNGALSHQSITLQEDDYNLLLRNIDLMMVSTILHIGRDIDG